MSQLRRMLPAMNLKPTEKACWLCVSFDGLTPNGLDAWCSNPECSRHRTNAAQGCSAFIREIGADDVPGWMPPAFELARVSFERHVTELERRQRRA